MTNHIIKTNILDWGKLITEVVITNKIEQINLEKLMNIYEESNWENLSMVRDLVGEDFDMVDKKYLY